MTEYRPGRKLNRFSVGTIDLRLKIKVGRETLDWIWINTSHVVPKDKGGHGRLTVSVDHVEGNRMGRCNFEQHRDLVQKPYILSSLPDIKTESCGSPSGVATGNNEYPVFQGKSRKALIRHGWLIEQGDIGPALAHVRRGQTLYYRFRTAGCRDINRGRRLGSPPREVR